VHDIAWILEHYPWSDFEGRSCECQCTGWTKKLAHFVLNALTSSNIYRLSNLFHCQNQENICYSTVTKDPTTPQVCRYTTLWNVLKATIENNDISQGSVATHLRCGGTFSDRIITNVLLIQTLKYRFTNRPIFDDFKAYEGKAYKKVCQFFGPPCSPILLNNQTVKLTPTVFGGTCVILSQPFWKRRMDIYYSNISSRVKLMCALQSGQKISHYH